MNELVIADRASEWRRLKSLVLDSVSSPITKRVYNLGLEEFIAWYTAEPRQPGFTKATVMAWRVALESRGLGPISINDLHIAGTALRDLQPAVTNGLRRGLHAGDASSNPCYKRALDRSRPPSLRTFLTFAQRSRPFSTIPSPLRCRVQPVWSCILTRAARDHRKSAVKGDCKFCLRGIRALNPAPLTGRTKLFRVSLRSLPPV
jgi:hypothetical protein